MNKENSPSAFKCVLHRNLGCEMIYEDKYNQKFSEIVTGFYHPMFTRDTLPKDLLLFKKPHMLDSGYVQRYDYPECEVAGCNYNCCSKKPHIRGQVSKSDFGALFYSTCHLHTNQCQELLEDLEWRNDDAIIQEELERVERNAQEGQVFKDKYEMLQKERTDVSYLLFNIGYLCIYILSHQSIYQS